ncbi:MAG: hypothetical protein ACO239_06620, partial [Sediminibacterium sp.]
LIVLLAMSNNDNIADALTTTTFVGGIAHFMTSVQPIVSFLWGIVAIVSGLFAIRYYYFKTKNINGKEE